MKTQEDLEQEADTKVPEEQEILLQQLLLKVTLEDQMAQDPLTPDNLLVLAEAELAPREAHLQVEDMELIPVPVVLDQQHQLQDHLLHTQVAVAADLSINPQIQAAAVDLAEAEKALVIPDLFL
jgi:hypothetical protein